MNKKLSSLYMLLVMQASAFCAHQNQSARDHVADEIRKDLLEAKNDIFLIRRQIAHKTLSICMRTVKLCVLMPFVAKDRVHRMQRENVGDYMDRYFLKNSDLKNALNNRSKLQRSIEALQNT